MNKNLTFLIILFIFELKTTMAQVVEQELNGFKEIEFNYSAQELENLGFQCAYVTCILYQENLNGLTFLNQPVLSKKHSESENINHGPELVVYLSDIEPRTISEIHVYVSLTGKMVAQNLKQTLGKPIHWNDWEYWFFKNGAALSTYNPKDGYFPSKTVFHSIGQSQQVLGQIMPNELKPTIDATDF